MIKYIVLAVLFLCVTAGASYYTLTHQDRQEVERLRAEHKRLEAQNVQLEQRNEDLKDQIVALREDPRLAERKARAVGNLARPNELIFRFEKPSDPLSVQVKLQVKADKIMLAGKAVSLDELPQALAQLRQRLPTSKLKVEWAEQVGALERQQVMEALAKAKVELPPSP